MGALISKEHLAKVNYYIDLARQEGGSIVLGGDKPDVGDKLANGTPNQSAFACFLSTTNAGYWLNPTIIAGLPYTSRVQQEEIFGPVVHFTLAT